jgi:hypothetical protein
MGQLAIVNAPSSFAFIWSIIKSWLATETQQKCDILGNDYKKVLLDMVDADSLPSTLGGNCMCEEGCHLSSVGPWLDGRVGWGPNSKAGTAVAEAKDNITTDNTTKDTQQHITVSGIPHDTTEDDQRPGNLNGAPTGTDP